MFFPMNDEQSKFLEQRKTITALNLLGVTLVVLSPKSGVPFAYWGENGGLGTISPESTEYPRTFSRVSAIKKARLKLQSQGYNPVYAFWLHDDAHLKPLAKYQAFQRCLPGCPRA